MEERLLGEDCVACCSAPSATTQFASVRPRSAAICANATPYAVMRHWHAHGLKPHVLRGFKASRDPRFVDKLEDIVAQYMSLPEHALVLCCDEKSQVQALDRTQPGLPLKRGCAQTMTHDDKRHGTTTLFAALNVLDGQVIGRCLQRHTHVQWLKFLRQIDRETPKDKTLHLIADNDATHKHPVVQQWLAMSGSAAVRAPSAAHGNRHWSGRWEQHPVANSFITNVFSDPSVTEWTRLWTQVFGLVNAGRCG